MLYNTGKSCNLLRLLLQVCGGVSGWVQSTTLSQTIHNGFNQSTMFCTQGPHQSTTLPSPFIFQTWAIPVHGLLCVGGCVQHVVGCLISLHQVHQDGGWVPFQV